jgi:hypothetical protein
MVLPHAVQSVPFRPARRSCRDGVTLPQTPPNGLSGVSSVIVTNRVGPCGTPRDARRESERLSDAREVLPIIVGAPRSGTTLLRCMLDCHPRLAVMNESVISRVWPDAFRRWNRVRAAPATGAVAVPVAHWWFERQGVSAEVLREQVERDGAADAAGVIRTWWALYARARGKELYGDKAPFHLFDIAALSRVFPESRFLHVIRDGRDSTKAFLDAPFGPDSLIRAAQLWRSACRTGRRAGRRLGPERYLEVRYERLVADPEGTLRAVCGFLGLEYTPVLLEYPSRADEYITAPHYQNLALAPTTGLRDWRRDMSQQELEVFEAVAGATLDEFGYPRATRPPVWLRVRCRTLARAWETRRHIARLRRRRRDRRRPRAWS